MNELNNHSKEHWNTIYSTKSPSEVSWTQETPERSLYFIHNTNLSKATAIIDIGGGDSCLVDYLLKENYTDITVLDISEEAINRAKMRLGKNASKIKWIVCDINTFSPTRTYDIWHDRAAFHFLTQPKDIERYITLINSYVSSFFIIGTFSKNGPLKCSGLDIKQYTGQDLEELVIKNFNLVEYMNEDHITPFETVQNFTFAFFCRN